MKRTLTLAVLTLAVGLSTASSTQACMYIRWLDPFAWMGFYGCGYGGCGYNPCGYGGCYNYNAMPQVYAPQAPVYAAPQTLSYPIAPTNTGCNCSSNVQQPALTAVQVPVTTYRPVTQYVPQTTYRTQYRTRYQAATPAYGLPQVAYNTIPSYSSIPSYNTTIPSYNTALATPTYSNTILPPQTYTQLGSPVPYGTPTLTTPTLPTPLYTNPAPGITPGAYPGSVPAGTGIASPVPGDVYGDHEYPTQSAVAPRPVPAVSPVRQASWTQPQFTRSYPLSVR